MSSDLLEVPVPAAATPPAETSRKKVDILLAAIDRFKAAIDQSAAAKSKRAAARWVTFRFNTSTNPNKHQWLQETLAYARERGVPQEVIDLLPSLPPPLN